MTNETQPGFGSDNKTLCHVKEIKLQLPLGTHVRLRAEKLLRGETIASTVNAAVAAYFERHPIHDALTVTVADLTA
ncbi:MAG TPA: hypothetical protein VGB18_00765, partial [Candidatus Thermoplasmatota archaeon]